MLAKNERFLRQPLSSHFRKRCRRVDNYSVPC
jgi:hypothetical protein